MQGLKPGWAVKALVVALLLRCFSAAAAATNHSVGGAFGWDLSSDLQEWASQASFYVGDSLVFGYTQVHEVQEVNQTDYDMCHTVKPLKTHTDGARGGTVIPLMEEGDRYFLCGRVGHCAMGLKLHVQVLPQLMIDSNATSSAPGPSPTAYISGPPHATQATQLFKPFHLVSLGLCTVSTVVNAVYTCYSVLVHGWQEQHQGLLSEFVLPVLTSTLVLHYDTLRGHSWMLPFKFVAIVTEIACLVVVFVRVQARETRVRNCIEIGVGNLLVPLGFLLTSSVHIVGSSVAISYLISLGWPVLLMKNIVTGKQTIADISLIHCILSLATASLWAAYSFLLRDLYIAIPNVFGVLTATGQIILVKVYRRDDGNSLIQPLLVGSEA